MMNIPFVDLKAQYATIKEEIDRSIAEVIAKTAFINGPFAKALKRILLSTVT
jgi:UDP-2-acetamido-2-deoxy-ribo-hexuluronate aminotransferase